MIKVCNDCIESPAPSKETPHRALEVPRIASSSSQPLFVCPFAHMSVSLEKAGVCNTENSLVLKFSLKLTVTHCVFIHSPCSHLTSLSPSLHLTSPTLLSLICLNHDWQDDGHLQSQYITTSRFETYLTISHAAYALFEFRLISCHSQMQIYDSELRDVKLCRHCIDCDTVQSSAAVGFICDQVHCLYIFACICIRVSSMCDQLHCFIS